MFKKPTLLFCIFFFMASFGTLILKVHVQNLSLDVKTMEVERNKLDNEIQVLKAEWSYLNNAERISVLAKKYLKMDRIQSKQIRYLKQDSVETPDIINETTTGDIRQVNIDWRYKSRIGILKISNEKQNDD
jgi:cell division protein FtsL